MQTITPPNLADTPRGLAYAMGNFDGVHLGHQAVIEAARNHGPLGVISFAPHPRRFFAPDIPRFELMRPADKNRALADLSVAAHVVLDFDAALAALSPEEFVTYIRRTLDPRHIAVGANFRFGRDRAGNAEILRDLCEPFAIGVTIVDISADQDTVYSSSAVRDALNDGDPRRARDLLGHWHIVSGIVEKGEQRGRELGFPTANLVPTEIMLPKFGIYATRLTLHDGPHAGTYYGAASTGVRPSFGENAPNFETFILDFDADIYDREVSVELIEFLRPEIEYTGVEALIAQMHADVARCREILGAEFG